MSCRASARLCRALVAAVESAALGQPRNFNPTNIVRTFHVRNLYRTRFVAIDGFQARGNNVLRLSGSHRFCSSTTDGKDVESDEEASTDALAQTILKLQHDALEISSSGHPEKCAQMLDEAGKLVEEEPNIGPTSQAGIGIFLSHTTVLLRAGMFEKLAAICEPMVSHLRDIPGVEKVLGMAWLRFACARTGLGDIRGAAEALHECSALLEPIAAEEEDNEIAFLYPELQFYSVLLSLYVAKSAKDIRDLENGLLQSISGMVDTAPRGAGPEWPFLVAALQAHSKLLHNAIDGDGDPDIIHALFKQITLLHRAAGCGPEDLSLVLYQYGTWVYAETEDLQQARDLVQGSLEELDAVDPAKADSATAVDDKEEDIARLSDEEKLARAQFNHQTALRRFRIAVIDSVMVAQNLRAVTPELSRETQGALSMIAATYDDLLGEENAISAECRFGLSLWGVQEGLRGVADTRAALEENMRRCLHVLARSMPSGKDHMLVQRLLTVYALVVGPYELVEEEAGHAHSHSHAHEHGEGCGHGAGDGGAHGHAHEHAHAHGDDSGQAGDGVGADGRQPPGR